METIKRILTDVRQGEKIDVYVLILVSILLAILSILDIVPDLWVPPITLAILGLLAISALNIRYGLEEVHNKLPINLRCVLLDRFPDDRWEKFEKEASDIWLIGSSLYYILDNYYLFFQNKLRDGCSMKVLVRNPSDEMCQLATRYTYIPLAPEQMRTKIETTLDRLCELKKIAPDKLEIRVLDYPLSFNIGALNPKTRNGMIYIEYHPYKMPQTGLPKVVVSANDISWYDFYTKQMYKIWEDGKEWKEE
jgi:hypothetical protein